ncbi:hypothetical protein PN36_13065 [Candidatus Thiomargarita nelsonii]|uniref:Lipoprotein n=1 Tax=Candidatus Thiomargarita nelsonii TaxID=1003181 RepID=A0A0A6RS30_9GAMM|nr:hypothetical protein PN36_13065 [Candidatus Thiomargarita nelsonii]
MFNNKALFKIALWGAVMVLCGSACSGKRGIAKTEVPARDVDFDIESIEVQPFQGQYGAKLAELVESEITREGYIKVVKRGGQTILTGSVSIGQVKSKPYRKSYKTKDEGTKYTFYNSKTLTTQATYSLKKGSQVIAGNNFTDDYKKEWSGQTAAEASAKADFNDKIIISSLNHLARQIVAAVSPHQEIWSFMLPCSRASLKLNAISCRATTRDCPYPPYKKP